MLLWEDVKSRPTRQTVGVQQHIVQGVITASMSEVALFTPVILCSAYLW